MDIKILYVNADGYEQEHSEAADSIKMASFKTANYELDDTKLGALVGNNDASVYHNHDNLYYRETEFISTSAGVADANKPAKTDAAGYVNGLINVASLNSVLDHGALTGLSDDDHLQYLRTDGTRNLTGIQSYAVHPSFTGPNQLVDKKYVDDLFAGDEWLNSADDRTITPPVSPTTGQRFLIDSTLGTPTEVWAGKENQVATWDGTQYTYEIPTTGTFIAVDDEPTVVYLFDGLGWDAKSFETTTASTGLVKVGADIQIDPNSAGNGLAFSAGIYSVNVDDSSIELNADALRVKALGIKDTMIDFGVGAGQVSAVDIPLADAGGYFTVDNVEAGLQQLAQSILSVGVDYTVGAGGVTKGDPLYISANNTVLKYGALTNVARIIGIALETKVAGETVKVLANDTIVTGVLSGAVAGATYYWNGTTYSTSIPSGAGAYVWKLGQAKNSTDLHVEIEFIKRNAV